MGLLLDMSPRALEEVIYFASYVVVDPGPTGLEKNHYYLKNSENITINTQVNL